MTKKLVISLAALLLLIGVLVGLYFFVIREREYVVDETRESTTSRDMEFSTETETEDVTNENLPELTTDEIEDLAKSGDSAVEIELTNIAGTDDSGTLYTSDDGEFVYYYVSADLNIIERPDYYGGWVKNSEDIDTAESFGEFFLNTVTEEYELYSVSQSPEEAFDTFMVTLEVTKDDTPEVLLLESKFK